MPSHKEAALTEEPGCDVLEVGGPSHRIGLSGANKRMLHLLKKAKVQLIKIDQQKQLKLSQVGTKILDFENQCKKIYIYIYKENWLNRQNNILTQHLLFSVKHQ